MLLTEAIEFDKFDVTLEQQDFIKGALDMAIHNYISAVKVPSERDCIKTYIRENFHNYLYHTGLDIEEAQRIAHNIARRLEVDFIPIGYQSYFVDLLLNNRPNLVNAMRDAIIILSEEANSENSESISSVYLKSNYVEAWMIDIHDYIRSNYQVLSSEILELLLRSYYSLEYSLRYRNDKDGNVNWFMFMDIFGLAHKHRWPGTNLIYYTKNISDYSELESIENSFIIKYTNILENNIWDSSEHLILFNILSDSEVAGNMSDNKFVYFVHLVYILLKYNEDKTVIEKLRHEITSDRGLYENVEDCKFYKFMIKMINNGDRNKNFVRGKTMLSYILDDICKIKLGKFHEHPTVEQKIRESLITMFCEIENQRSDYNKNQPGYFPLLPGSFVLGDFLTYLSKIYMDGSTVTQYERKIIDKIIKGLHELSLLKGNDI